MEQGNTNSQRMYLDTLRNQVISSNTVENPKSRIRKKVKLKIPAKAKLIDNYENIKYHFFMHRKYMLSLT